MAQLHPWRYPTPFDLHYSEDWRARFEQTLADGASSEWNKQRQDDEDLAAHITITRLHGIALFGRPIGETLPEVPTDDYAASLYGDLLWEIEYLESHRVNCVLNSCRIYACLAEKLIFSKDQGAVWALNIVPDEHHPVITAALAAYRGEGTDEDADLEAAKRFAEYIAQRVREVYDARAP
jgi:streptomycin 3"-adenylyltransferase